MGILILLAKTLFPKDVTFTGNRVRASTYLCGVQKIFKDSQTTISSLSIRSSW